MNKVLVEPCLHLSVFFYSTFLSAFFVVFLTPEAHAQHEFTSVVDKSVPRSMGCKLYANEVRLQLTFKLPPIFN